MDLGILIQAESVHNVAFILPPLEVSRVLTTILWIFEVRLEPNIIKDKNILTQVSEIALRNVSFRILNTMIILLHQLDEFIRIFQGLSLFAEMLQNSLLNIPTILIWRWNKSWLKKFKRNSTWRSHDDANAWKRRR